MKKVIASLLFALTFTATKAQYFLPPIESGQVTMSKKVFAVTNDGDTIYGRITAGTLINGQMRSFTLKEENKTKHKFKAADVKSLAVQPTKLMNFSSAMSTPNIQRAGELDMNKVMDREWIYFEQAMLPNKEKYALMQLLNSGFDSKLKIYLDPSANETMSTSINGLQISGGEDKSYLVVFDGGEQAEVFKKSKYDKQALKKLYKDCEAFEENYGDEKFKWQDFQEHVFVYDQLCE